MFSDDVDTERWGGGGMLCRLLGKGVKGVRRLIWTWGEELEELVELLYMVIDLLVDWLVTDVCDGVKFKWT